MSDVNRRAFGQDAAAVLVDALRAGGYAEVSLVAEVAGRVVGHILFSRLPIRTAAGTVDAVSLAPMAVLPDHQRHGIGGELVRAGLEARRAGGHRIAVVLGHPAFYRRFGFTPPGRAADVSVRRWRGVDGGRACAGGAGGCRGPGRVLAAVPGVRVSGVPSVCSRR